MDRDKLGDMILLPPHKPFTHLLVIHPIRTDWAPSGAVLEVPWPLVSPVGRGGGEHNHPVVAQTLIEERGTCGAKPRPAGAGVGLRRVSWSLGQPGFRGWESNNCVLGGKHGCQQSDDSEEATRRKMRWQ